MRTGERIYVRRTDGTLAVFTVTAVRIYAEGDYPTAMASRDPCRKLNSIITCGGTFDYARRSYLSNVVVYARLSTRHLAGSGARTITHPTQRRVRVEPG